MCSVDDCEPWAIYNEARRKARKTHICEECGRGIAAGEEYLRIEGLCDGKWSTYKLCQHCDAASTVMRVMCNGWPLGDLWQELVEHWADGYRSVPFARLIAGVKLRWHDGRDPVPTGCGDLARQLMAGVA